MNKILDEYKNVSDEYLILFFEPWKCDSADNIVKTFFNLLKEKLNPYIPSISHEINNYLEFLSPVVENHIITLLKQYCNSLNGVKYNAYDKLSVTLESAKIPTIVFVDDIDRLNADEILEVLKLVRNTANLPYIQFIVAYDFKYICETLNENGIKNPSKYIEKFFDVDLPLPSFEDSVISGELFKRIEPIFKEIWPEDIAYIKQVIYLAIEGADISKKHITYIVSNMRDVIRFSNSFKLLAKLYFDNDLHKRIKGNHLFLLELIRYKYSTIYEILRTNPLYLLQIQNKNTYILNEYYESRIRELIGEKEYETHLLLYIIRILFVNESENAIRNIRYYSNYFMYREDSRFLKKYEILYLLTLADNEMLVSPEQMYKEKYPREFYNVLKGLLETSQGENTLIEIIELYRLIFILLRTNEDSMRSELINLYISHLAVTQLDVYEIVEDYFQKQIDIRVFDLQIDIILLISENYFDTKKLYNYILRWLQIKSIKERTLDFKENSESYKNTFLKFLSFKGNILNKSDALNQIINSFYEETEETLILDLEQLINVLKEYFIGFEKKLSDTGFKLYNNCAEIVAKYGGVDYQYIATEIKEAIMLEINMNPDRFFETLIVKESNNGRHLRLENFYNNIFENKDEIETFILTHQESKYHELVKNFWILYKANKFNDILFFADTDIDALCDEELKTSVEQLGRMHHMLDILQSEIVSENILNDMQNELRTFSLRINIRKELEKEIKERLGKNMRK